MKVFLVKDLSVIPQLEDFWENNEMKAVEITPSELKLLKQGLQAFAMSKEERALLKKLESIR